MPRIISWNTQGSGIAKLYENYKILLTVPNNIIMIQEAGNVGKGSGESFDVTYGTSSRGHHFTGCFFEQPDVGNIRCTTGILVEKTITKNPIFHFCYLDCKRPVVYFEYTLHNVTTGNDEKFVFATAHLTANESKAKNELTTIFNTFEREFNNAHWIIMGDFNCNAITAKTICHNQISSPPGPTHQSGRILDYALHSKNLIGVIKVINGVPNDEHMMPLNSDHYPISCSFEFG